MEFYEDTHGNVYSHRLSYLVYKVRKGGGFFYGTSNENTLKAYDHKLVDQSAKKIVELQRTQDQKLAVLYLFQQRRKL